MVTSYVDPFCVPRSLVDLFIDSWQKLGTQVPMATWITVHSNQRCVSTASENLFRGGFACILSNECVHTRRLTLYNFRKLNLVQDHLSGPMSSTYCGPDFLFRFSQLECRAHLHLIKMVVVHHQLHTIWL